jgi:hypothetical protein
VPLPIVPAERTGCRLTSVSPAAITAPTLPAPAGNLLAIG